MVRRNVFLARDIGVASLWEYSCVMRRLQTKGL